MRWKLFLIRLADAIDVLLGHPSYQLCHWIAQSSWWDAGMAICGRCGIERADGWFYKHKNKCIEK
jgi:hypothetical protein